MVMDPQVGATGMFERGRWRQVGVPGLRSAVTLAGLLGWVLFPDERAAGMALLGLGLVTISVAELTQVRSLASPGRPAAVVRGLAPAAGGAVLITGTAGSSGLTLAAGVVLAVRAAGDLWAAVTVGSRVGLRPWLLGLAAFEALGALAGILLTDLFGQAALVSLAFAWMAGSVVAGVRPNPEYRQVLLAPVPPRGAMSEQERTLLADAVHYDGPEARRRLERFLMLLTIATIIATYGVLQGSVAAVIGGMIVAPLMGPIQALAVGLLAGSTRRAFRAAVLLVGGIGLVLVVSMLIAATNRDLPSLLAGEQVVIRTAPGLPDLAVALAAGAAGGLALVRRDVADSLPGVAIAVSLVPPLCVAGATLAGGLVAESTGAFLLFAVNMIAIVMATGAVLVLSGFGSVAGRGSDRLMTLSVASGVALVALAVPLATSGRTTIQEESMDRAVRTSLDEWLQPIQPASVDEVRIDGDRVTVVVVASEQPGDPAVLEQQVAEEVGRSVTIEVLWVEAQTVE